MPGSVSIFKFGLKSRSRPNVIPLHPTGARRTKTLYVAKKKTQSKSFNILPIDLQCLFKKSSSIDLKGKTKEERCVHTGVSGKMSAREQLM